MKKTALLMWLIAPVMALHAGTIDMTPYNSKKPRGIRSSTRDLVCLNGVWEFSPVKSGKDVFGDEFPDPVSPPVKVEWEDITVPGLFHNSRGGATTCAPDGSPQPGPVTEEQSAWCRRSFDVPSEWRDKAVSLRFEAVAFYAKVFVNGVSVGEHKGPITPFEFDISDKIKYGEKNELAVYVIDQNKVLYCPPDVKGYARFGQTFWEILPEVWAYRGQQAGIWQDVWIEARPKLFIEDIFAMPSFRNMEITGRVEVKNESDEPKANLLVLDVLDMEGNKVLEIGRNDVAVLPHSMVTIDVNSGWKDPLLWDIGEPNMYTMRARLHGYTANNELMDEKLVRFGFRETWVDGGRIYLNGRILHAFGDWITDAGVGTPAVTHRYEYNVAKFKGIMDDLNFVCSRHIGHGAQAVYDAADDTGFGMMPTGYASIKISPESFRGVLREMAAYVRKLRNHPSVLIWSVQNESLLHVKTRDLFVLQRALDETLVENDPTRPYYHDGHTRIVPEDPGATYEVGDLMGNAPISGGHYTSQRTVLSRWMHEFEPWRKKKPFIYGEAGTFGKNDIPRLVNMYYGNDAIGRTAAELEELGGRFMKMMVGCWRTYAVNGIMAHGTYQSSSYSSNPMYGRDATKFVWNTLETPGTKPFELHHVYCKYNPYEPENPPKRTGLYATWMKKAYAPFLMSLARELRHNYFSGDIAEQTAYLVNDSKTDIDVVLEWKLIDNADGRIVSAHEEDVTVSQGVPVARKWMCTLPFARSDLQLTVSATTPDSRFHDEDSKAITVYPRMPAPKLVKEYHVHDPEGRMTALLNSAGANTAPMDENTFAGDCSKKVLIIAPMSFDDNVGKYREQIDTFIAAGGTVVIMDQNVDFWWSGTSNLRVDSLGHPLFKGLDGLPGSMLYFWAGENNTVADSGYIMPGKGAFINHAGPYYMEMKKGKGSLIGCNLKLVDRYEMEPEARILLLNLLRYADAARERVRPMKFVGAEDSFNRLTNTLADAQLAAPGNIGELDPGSIVLVESSKDIAKHAEAVGKFVRAGGTLVVSRQTDKTWDNSWLNGEITLHGVAETRWMQMEKIEACPLLSGVSAETKGIKFGFKPAEGIKDWHLAYMIYDQSKPANNNFGFRDSGSSGCYALVWKEFDKGRIVLSQLDMSHPALLSNLGAEFIQPEPEIYLEPFAMLKESAVPVSPVTPAMRKKYEFLNLKYHANAVFQGEKYDAGILNVHMRNLPTGDWVFAGVPFHIVNSDLDEFVGGDPGAAKSLIVLKGARQPNFPESAKRIPIDAKASKLHFLHTLAWGINLRGMDKNTNYDVVVYRVTYKDGTTAEVTAKNNVHILDWFVRRRMFRPDMLKEARAGWAEVNLEASYCYGVLWVMTWDNPHPEKQIQSLDIISSGNAVPLIFAVTLEK